MIMDDNPQVPNGAPPPPPPAAEQPPASEQPPAPQVSENRTIMVVLAYLGLLALIPLLVEKNDSEVQWHAKHGLVLTVFEVVLFIAVQVVAMILGAISGGLGCLFGLLFPILALGILVLHVVCIAKGVKGERFTLPTVSEFADRF
jgi:uncharacterized membrane protein